MKQSDLHHLRRLLGWLSTKVRKEGPSAPLVGEAETYASRLLSAMTYRKVGVSTLAGATGMHYQGVKQAIEGRSKSFSAANNMRVARFLEISPHWLATGQGAMLVPDATVPPYVVDAVKALEKALAAGGRDRGVETASATAETRANIGLAPGAGAGREPALDDVQIELGLAEIGVYVWGQRGEDWLAGAEYAARLLRAPGLKPPPVDTSSGHSAPAGGEATQCAACEGKPSGDNIPCAVCGRDAAPQASAERGEVVVTWDADRSRILAVTRQDEDGRILSVIAEAPAPTTAKEGERCWCETCRPITMEDMRMVLCPTCGNKRCPRANNHRNACTGSNRPGQTSSAYPAPAIGTADAGRLVAQLRECAKTLGADQIDEHRAMRAYADTMDLLAKIRLAQRGDAC